MGQKAKYVSICRFHACFFFFSFFMIFHHFSLLVPYICHRKLFCTGWCFRMLWTSLSRTSEINCTGIESCKFCWHQAVFLLASGVCLRPWWEFNGIKPYVLCRLQALFNMIAYSKTGKNRWDSTSFEAVWGMFVMT